MRWQGVPQRHRLRPVWQAVRLQQRHLHLRGAHRCCTVLFVGSRVQVRAGCPPSPQHKLPTSKEASASQPASRLHLRWVGGASRSANSMPPSIAFDTRSPGPPQLRHCSTPGLASPTCTAASASRNCVCNPGEQCVNGNSCQVTSLAGVGAGGNVGAPYGPPFCWLALACPETFRSCYLLFPPGRPHPRLRPLAACGAAGLPPHNFQAAVERRGCRLRAGSHRPGAVQASLEC